MIKRLFLGIYLLLLTSLIYLGVLSFYRVLSSKIAIPPSAIGYSNDIYIKNKAQKIYKPIQSYASIKERNIFNSQNDKAEIKEEIQEVIDLPETTLNLKLYGTIAGQNTNSYAIIEDSKTKKQDLYSVGDTIQNAKITRILKEQVILSLNGKDQTLSMEKNDDKSLKRSGQPYSSNQPPSLSYGDIQTVNVQKTQIDDAFNNLPALMGQINIRPYIEQGRPEGLLVSRVQPNSIFTQLGLESGDIIKGVNGEAISSVDDALKFYDQLRSASSVSLQIKRKGQDKTIDFNIN
ncbi:MAG: type II secretion system protein GspC [Desulfobacterales bacterium]|nr:type II secretion system protein GspC [Desulfobacterales bacterium]